MNEINRKLTAILSADAVGYSRLMAEDEVGTVDRLKSYRELISVRVKEHHGRVIDSPGDNLLAEFPSALDAVRSAVEIQRVLKTRNDDLPDNRKMEFRIGIHLGDVMMDGDRIYGDGVNIAARLESLADPGGICISATVHEQVHRKQEVTCEDIGNQEVKNIPDPIRAYKISRDRVKTESIKEENISIPEKPSIVVLPFVNMSPDVDQEYFSDGLTEEIITDLSHIKDLLVISRSSAMTFKGSNKTIPEFARSVNVRYVLEGSVRKAGNNLRITAQLIDSINDAHLWAEKYTGVLDDVFDIQEKVSRSIVGALKVKITSTESDQLAERPIENIQVYELHLKAREQIFMPSKEALDRAIQYLKNGLALIGENALLYSDLGYACYQLVNTGKEHEEYIEKSVDYANKALELDNNSAEAHMVLGCINQAFWGNQKQAFYHLKLAHKISPNDAHVMLWIVIGYHLIGRPEKSRPLILQMQKVDPFNLMFKRMSVVQNVREGRFNLSVDEITSWYRMLPHRGNSHYATVMLLLYCGYLEEARAFIQQHNSVEEESVQTQFFNFIKHALEGNKHEMEQLMSDQIGKTVQRDPEYSLRVGELYALAGIKEAALDWISNAVDRGFINYPFLNDYDPLLENIRDEERFKKLMEIAKHEWENFEVE